jgi:multidrug resistance protein, MATE family
MSTDREDARAGSAVTHRTVLALAAPVMLANVSTPLLGAVDTGIVGRYPDPAYIGAVAVGALIFTLVFWGFGFLRMGTTGLTAQAFGARASSEVAASLARALLIAAAAGAALIVLQWPIREIAFAWMGTSPRVEHLARGYFAVRIWSAPAALANYALLGWYIGLGRTDTGLVLQLVLNVVNMALDAFFVLVLGWDVRGVALGTMIAEYVAAGVGGVLAVREMRRLGAHATWASVLDRPRLKRAVVVNRDIMIRSLALIAVFAWFMAQSARAGNVVLAGNAILMQFIAVAAFFLDGLAFAAEALVGRAVGAARREPMLSAARLTTLWAAIIAALLSLVFALLGPSIIDLLSVNPAARAQALKFLPWAVGVPVIGVWAFQLDGIFIGATRTADMRTAMLFSLAVFLGAWWLLRADGNAGLWGAFYVHYVVRALSLLYFYPRLVRSVAGVA